MATIAVGRIKKEFQEVIKSDEVGNRYISDGFVFCSVLRSVRRAHDDIRILCDFKFYVPHSTSDDVFSLFVMFFARTIQYL